MAHVRPVTLFHRDFGGAEKPPLLILHGLLGSSRNWQTAGAALAQHFHVYALDLRNHGRSPHEAEMTYESMLVDVLAWMDGQGLGSAVLLGHSMGGKVAMLLACRFPTRVERLMVVDIAPKQYSAHAHAAEFAAMNAVDLHQLHSRAEAESRFEMFVPDWGMRKFLATNLVRDEATGAWRWLINLPVLTATLLQIEANPLTEYDRYSGRTDIIVGEKSNYVQPADHAAIKRHFSQAKFSVVAYSGHNPHMETREEFVKIILG